MTSVTSHHLRVTHTNGRWQLEEELKKLDAEEAMADLAEERAAAAETQKAPTAPGDDTAAAEDVSIVEIRDEQQADETSMCAF